MRLPLATDIKTRTGVPDKDARLKNSYVETKGDQSAVRKRPAAQGGIAVGTGTAQGGIGLNINGTPYFIGFWADTMQAYTGGGTNWNAGTAYAIGGTVWVIEDENGDPIIAPPDNPFDNAYTPKTYYAQGPNTNLPPSLNPNIWGLTPPPSTRYYAYGSGYDGTLHTTGSCATTLAATQALFNMLTKVSCPGNYPPQSLWLMEPLSVVGLGGYAHGWGTTDTPPYNVCPGMDGGVVQFATIVQTA